jgi:hypothetical protein
VTPILVGLKSEVILNWLSQTSVGYSNLTSFITLLFLFCNDPHIWFSIESFQFPVMLHILMEDFEDFLWSLHNPGFSVFMRYVVDLIMLSWRSIIIRDAPGTVFAGYPGNQKAGYRTSDKGRIPEIRPDTWLDSYIFLVKYQLN